MNEAQAVDQVARIAGSGAGFEAVEFDGGWLVTPRSNDTGRPLRGATNYVVDKADHSVRRFPSSIPPRRLVSGYSALKQLHSPLP